MLRGNWRHIVAALGWLALCGQSPEHRTTTQGTQRTQAAQESAPPVLSPTKAVEQVETSEYERPCEQGRDERNSDLCAQWKAADAARDAAEWAKWQLLLGIIGAAGLLVTIHYTRRAVLAAFEANQNAHDTLTHAKEMAAVELRPYLHVDEIAFDKPETLKHRPSVIVRVKNFGATPATRFRFEAAADLRNKSKFDAAKGLRTRRIPSVDEIPPGHLTTIHVPGPPQGSSLNISADFFCTIRFEYSDKFGTEHVRWETYRAEGSLGRSVFRFFCQHHRLRTANDDTRHREGD